MDSIENDRKIIKTILSKYAKIPHANGQIDSQTVFDDDNNRYLLISIGWDKKKRVHHIVMHVDIIDDKIWIQCDNTDAAIAIDLEEAGIPKDRIVLGFRSPKIRQYTDYAVA